MQRMEDFDVLIIGAGPAGSTLARNLQHSGLHIALIDKSTFPRNKVCAGWVTPEVMRLLNIDPDDYAQGHVLQQINGFKVGLSTESLQLIDYPQGPISYGVRRIEFDHYLLQKSATQLLPAETVVKLEKISEGIQSGWIVNDKYRSKLIVGAGGHFCPVAQAMKDKAIIERAVLAQEVEFEMDAQQLSQCTIDEKTPELYFSADLLGYGWIFRKGNYLNIGLGREDKNHLSTHVKIFYHSLTERSRTPQQIPPAFNGHAYLLYPHSARKMLGDNYLLIGDAAGLAYARSGEGIRPAVESAILAAEVITSSNGNYSQKKLRPYQALIESRFGQRPAQPQLFDYLPEVFKTTLARSLMKTEWFSRNILIDKWFLQSRQKPLSRTAL